MGYELDSPSSFPAAQDSSVLHSFQIDSGANPVSSQWVLGAFFSREVKEQGREALYSPHLMPISWKVELYEYFHSLVYLHGIVLN
jgi:hypothetical protein